MYIRKATGSEHARSSRVTAGKLTRVCKATGRVYAGSSRVSGGMLTHVCRATGQVQTGSSRSLVESRYMCARPQVEYMQGDL